MPAIELFCHINLTATQSINIVPALLRSSIAVRDQADTIMILYPVSSLLHRVASLPL